MCRTTWNRLVLSSVAAVLAFSARAAFLENVPQEVAQPDGTVLHLLATGDEYFSVLHDERGFVVLRDGASGWLVYAAKEGGRLVATANAVGRSDPEAEGLRPGLRPDSAYLPKRREPLASADGAALLSAAQAPEFTQINNIVVFVRFADEEEFSTARPLATYEAMFNASDGTSSSLRSYFRAASYGQLTVDSTFYPRSTSGFVASFRDSHPRSYFMPYDATTNPGGYTESNSRAREHQLLADAVAAVAAQVPASLVLDANADGSVDNVCFIVSGAPTAWSTLLWPHQWSQSRSSRINDKKVSDYNFQLETMVRVGVLCHEMTHTLGAPDLYRYSDTSITPVGRWDLMASTTDPPQGITARIKQKYLKWIPEIPAITASGTYRLAPASAAPGNAFKIASPNSALEYFVVEYRRRAEAFEGTLPGSGLVVYRVHTRRVGNADGPPDEIYVFRPGGSQSSNGYSSRAAFSADAERTAIDGSTDPSPFLSDGSLGGLAIFEVGPAGDDIAFRVDVQQPCALGGFALQAPESPFSGAQAALAWTAAAGASSYDLYFGTAADPPLFANVAGLDQTVDVSAGQTYHWRVVARNECGRFGAAGGTWTLTVDPVLTPLLAGVPAADLAREKSDGMLYLRIDVPSRAHDLVITTEGGTGDADLLLRAGHFPSPDRNDCVSLRAGNVERCSVASPSPGAWYVGLLPFEDFAGVSITATWEVARTPRARLGRP